MNKSCPNCGNDKFHNFVAMDRRWYQCSKCQSIYLWEDLKLKDDATRQPTDSEILDWLSVHTRTDSPSECWIQELDGDNNSETLREWAMKAMAER